MKKIPQLTVISKLLLLYFVAVIAIGYLFLLGGCAGSEMASTMINEAGETVPFIADASVLKEQAVHKSWQNYQTEYTKAYNASGFSMAFDVVEIAPGKTAYMPTAISYKEKPDIVAPPAAPSEHPVWGSINTAIKTITPYGFGYLAVDSIVGGYESISDNSGDHYNGPVQMSGSHNISDDGQTINAGEMQQDQGNRENSPDCADGECVDDNTLSY